MAAGDLQVLLKATRSGWLEEGSKAAAMFDAFAAKVVVGVDLSTHDDLSVVQIVDADGGYLVPPQYVESIRYALATRRKASAGWRRHCRALKAAGKWAGKEVSRYIWGAL